MSSDVFLGHWTQWPWAGLLFEGTVAIWLARATMRHRWDAQAAMRKLLIDRAAAVVDALRYLTTAHPDSRLACSCVEGRPDDALGRPFDPRAGDGNRTRMTSLEASPAG